MNELQKTNQDGIRISSREVAEMMEIEHKNLIRKIDNINKDFDSAKLSYQKYWTKSTFKNRGKTYREYQISKLGCEFLAHKTNGTKGNLFTAKYMDKFEMMEKYIKEQNQISPEDQAVLNIIYAEDKLDKALAIKDYKDIIEKPLLQEIDRIKPLAQKFEAFLKDDGLIDINTFAKTLGIKNLGRNNMYKYLRDNHYIDKNNYAMQRYINQKLFILKPRGYKENFYGERTYIFKTFITKKGLAYLLGKLVEDGYITFTDDNKNN